jgi:deltex
MTPGSSSPSLNGGTATNVVWEWEDDSGFVAYDAQTCAILEAAHAGGQNQIDLTHGYFGSSGGYSIDLSQLTQTKKASGYSRNIRRIDPNAAMSMPIAPVKRPKAVSTLPAPNPPPAMDDDDNSIPSPVQPTPPAVVTPTVTPVPSNPPTPGAPVWEFSAANDDDDDSGNWKNFDNISTRLIEGAVKTGRSSTTLNHGAYLAQGGCFLDFATMEMRENKTNKIVKIRRTPPLTTAIKSPKLDHSGGANPTTASTSAAKKKGAKKADVAPLTAEETALKKLTNWKDVADKEIEDKDNCPVCLCALKEDGVQVVRLGKCMGHFFHRGCVLLCYQHSKNQFVRCPICTTIYGILTGPQPKGTMTHSKNSSSLPGYPKCGTITVNYSFPNGTQGPEHPHPGRQYTGTSRTGYLPDNAEGNEVLRLLKIAFDRKLVFRIGQSVTTGADDQVVWNGVHHKTSTTGGASNYGYPDETYLERVKDELAQKGVE